MSRMNKRYVDIDDVLDLFGIDDEDIYAKGTIEDALYDGTLKVYKLPSVERHGKWIDPEDSTCYKCSVCGEYATQEYGLTEPIFWRYCPNCGARME